MTEVGAGRALVTGAGGMLAHDLVPALRKAGWIVTALGRPDLDVTDPAQCLAAVEGHDVVVNTAAYTAVDAAESDEAAAFAVNAVGAAYVARACTRAGARLVHLSTDYVFDGNATAPYRVDHPVAPRSAYGRTKAAGEWAVRALCGESWVVRTAWLYGAGGPNFASKILQLAQQGERLTVVDDQTGQPTSTSDLSALLVRLIASEAPFGVYHGTSSGETTWYNFARAVLESQGIDPERVVATTSDKFQRPAPRPTYSVLSHDTLRKTGLLPIQHWRSGVSAAVSEIRKLEPPR